MIYRGYGYLQQELGELEQELVDYDDEHSGDSDIRRAKSWEQDRMKSADEGNGVRTRPLILSDIRKKLLEYGRTHF